MRKIRNAFKGFRGKLFRAFYPFRQAIAMLLLVVSIVSITGISISTNLIPLISLILIPIFGIGSFMYWDIELNNRDEDGYKPGEEDMLLEDDVESVVTDQEDLYERMGI